MKYVNTWHVAWKKYYIFLDIQVTDEGERD